ncbi:MAG: hypothetical protein WKF58_10155 [Ilumatobacteraceae bacterium]
MSDRIDERIDDPFTVDDDVDLDDRPPAEFEPVAAPPDDGARFDDDGEFDSDAAAPRDHEASLARRAGTRLVRRPVEWWNRPWDAKRTVTTTATALTLTIVTLVMMKAVSFWPFQPSENLVFKNTTPNGGDMGAHVWGPAYLRDVLLPSGRLNGWTMDWYAGMPAYRFYMIPPALAIVALNVVFPYGIAFKIVAVTGLVLFPISCWAFGRLARFRYPMPELFAFAALCFALDESFSIYGGNVKSTMAGEFSFSIAITAMMFGLGLLARGLETGKYRAWAALLLAFAAVSHGIVLIYVAVAASVFAFVWLVITYQWADDEGKRRRGTTLMLAGTGVLLILGALSAAGVDALAEVGPLPLDVLLGVVALAAIVAGAVLGAVADTGRRIWYIVTIGITALLLLLWWAGPFLSGHDFMTDMKYEARPSGAEDSFWDMFFPHTTVLDVLITGLALIGLVAAVARRHITGVALGVVAFIAVAGVYFARDGLPFIGLLWNPRVLPLLYLMRYLLMAIGVAEIGAQVFNMIKNRGSHTPIRWKAGTVTLASGGLAVLLVFGFMFEVLPGGSTVTKGGEAVYAWGPIAKNGPGYQALGDSWAKYNFRGYEEKDDYPEYRNVVTTMGDLGETRGCGRALLGASRGQRQVRHADGVDAAAVLDRRLHRADGGSVLRGVRHDAVPLPRHRGDVGGRVQPGAQAALLGSRCVRRGARDAIARHPLRHAPYEGGQGGGGDERPARARRQVRPVGDLRAGELGGRRAARSAARGRQQARGRPARAQPRARDELVPEPPGLAGDACRRRAGLVAADQRARRRASARRQQRGRRVGPGRRGRAGEPHPTGDARSRPGERGRDGRPVAVVPRRPSRCARAGEGQLLPQLVGRGR